MECEKIRILLIEDNPGDARLLKELLSAKEGASFDLENVDRISTALARLARGNIDVILLDLSLPDSHGLEGLRKILAQTLEMPIVVLSGLNDEAVAINAVQEGAQDYLVKGSVDSDSLVRSLHYAIERQHLRVALHESESRYRLLADNIADVIWTANMKRQITYASPSIKGLLGYTAEEAMKLKMDDILAPASFEQAHRIVADQIEIRTPTSYYPPPVLTLEHVRKDGSTLWAEVMLSFLWDKDKKLISIMGATRDITERKKAEEALRDSENQYRSLVDTASKAGLGITIVQDTQDKEAVFVFANDEYCKLSGYSRAELLERSAWNTVPPDDLAATRERYRQRQRGKNIAGHYEANLLRKDGTLLPIELSVSTSNYQGETAIVSFFKDITERKKAEEALRASENQYRSLVDTASKAGLGITIVQDTQDEEDVFVFANDEYSKLSDYPGEKLLGRSSWDIVPPDKLAAMREWARKIKGGENITGSHEIELVHKDGTVHNIEISVSASNYQGKAAIVSFHKDITRRKKAEDALRASEAELKAIFDNATDGIALFDVEGKVIRVNRGALEAGGYDTEELAGKPLDLLNMFTPESIEKMLAARATLLSGGEAPAFECEVITKSGKKLIIEIHVAPFRKNGELMGSVAVLRDITERKKAEEALQQSEERYRELFENANDIIYTHDLAGNFTSINKAGERVTGYTRDEVLAMNISNILPPESLEQARRMIACKVNQGGRTEYELEIITRDEHRLLLEVSTRLIYEGDKPVGVQGIARDITERKKMEQALKESEERLRRYWDSSPDAIYIHDLKGTFLRGNKAGEELLGYPTDEIEGRSFLELSILPPQYLSKAIQLLQLSEAGKPTGPDEFELIRKDGRHVFVEISAYPMTQGDKIEVIGIARDITERKKMEQQLIRLSDAVKMSTDSIIITDLEGTILDTNDASLKLYGADNKADVIGLTSSVTAFPEDRGRILANLAKVTEKGSAKELHCHILTRDGRKILIETSASLMRSTNGEPIGVVSVSRDITERNRMEEALRESEERFRRLVDSAPDIIFRWSVEKGAEYISPIVTEITGYTPEEVMAEPLLGLRLTGHFDKRVAEEYERIVKEGTSDQIRELSFLRKDGKQAHLEMRANAIKDGKGRVIAFEGILRDITDQKLAEEALRQSERNYRALFESKIDSLMVIDAETLKIVLVNQSAAEMFGFNYPEKAIGVDVFDVIHPEERDDALKLLREAGAEKKDMHKTKESRCITKDGRTIWTNVLGAKTVYQGRRVFLASIRDITERKQMEEALKRSEQNYRVLFNSITDGLIVMDAETTTLLLANDSVARMAGVDSSQDLIGGKPQDFFPPEEWEKAYKIFSEGVSAKNFRDNNEYHVFNKNDKDMWINAITTRIEYQGKMAALVSIQDITERKKMEDALRKSEHKYRFLFDSIPNGLIVMDAETTTLMLANEASAAMAGFDSPQELIGIKPQDYLSPEEWGNACKILNEEVLEKDLHLNHEYHVFNKDGKSMWINVVSAKTEYQGKIAVLVSIQDITERKRMEEQLYRAGRLAAVGELAAGVAHELNNPLTAIQGFAQFLTARKDLDETVRKDLDTIYRESRRAAKITQNLLAFARRHEPEKHLISINEAIEKTLELRANSMRVNNIELVVELAPNLPKTLADFHQMQQVFVNIINNAEQAMMETHGRGRLVVRTQKAGDIIRISFADNGPGISDKDIKRIFDPFFTTKEVGKGTGLGLSICYGLVEAHGGRIYAKSKLGQGAIFVVELPIVSQSLVAEAALLNPVRGV